MLLMDTHAFVWLASNIRKLPGKVRQAIREEAGALFVSGISGLEMALAAKRGRLDLPTEAPAFIR